MACQKLVRVDDRERVKYFVFESPRHRVKREWVQNSPCNLVRRWMHHHAVPLERKVTIQQFVAITTVIEQNHRIRI